MNVNTNTDVQVRFEQLKKEISAKEIKQARLETTLEQAVKNIETVEAEIKTLIGSDDITKVDEILKQLIAKQEELEAEAHALIDGAY